VIWLIFLGLLAGVGAYLMLPFLRDADPEALPALEEARRQRAVVDLDEAEGRLGEQAASEAKDALDRRILELLDAPEQKLTGERLKSMALGIVPAALLIGGFGVYSWVGSPNYAPITFAEYEAQQIAELPDTLEELVVELRARLAADPSPPADGYVLLARSYLRLGDVENALAAYETALEISGSAEAIVTERDRVVEMLEAQSAAPQIDPETRAQIESMSAEEQMAMINNMVDRLALRLAEDPNDFEGWMRLIRARTVMGDLEQARRDLEKALEVFPRDTERGQILQAQVPEVPPSEGNVQ
jgi:cytochrome c-type biogenesis protein CcmI